MTQTLDAEARFLLDLMEQAVQNGRPKLNSLSAKVGRPAVDKMSEDGEADPPQVAEVADGGFAGPASEIRFRRYRPMGVAAGLLPLWPVLIPRWMGEAAFGTLSATFFASWIYSLWKGRSLRGREV